MLQRSLKRRPLFGRLAVFFAILGPGLITATADNDATGILGYSQAGAQYQYSMIWALLLAAAALGVCQEICARMGAVTGKGLADLIREEFGVRITILAMAALLVANFATTVAEFAGILAAVAPFAGDLARWVVVPASALAVWLLVSRGSYRGVERVMLFGSLIYLTYVGSAVLCHPDWGEVARRTVMPDFSTVKSLGPYVFMIINIVGTTITPWEQFYVQAAIRDKGLRAEEYRYIRLDVWFGAVTVCIVAACIMVCCGATLHQAGIRNITDPGQAAHALAPIAGGLASLLFSIGLFNASCFGAIVVPLSTSYAITEALGWESGIGRRTAQAPLFTTVYTVMIVAASLIVILFPRNLTFLIILPNIIGGALLPIILVLMLLLVNKRRIMGNAINSRAYNVVAWVTTGLLVLLSLVLLVTMLFGGG